MYPYYINTGLFEGYKPRLRFVLPTLDANYVSRRIFDAILAEEKEVYIRGVIFYIKNVMMMMPLRLRHYLSHVLAGEGMEYFVGRANQNELLD